MIKFNENKTLSHDTLINKENLFFKYLITYGLIQFFVIINLLSITDAQLLQYKQGFNIPIINANTSIIGFFTLSTLLIAVTSIFISKEYYLIEKQKQKLKTRSTSIFSYINNASDKIESKLLSCFVTFLFFISGPIIEFMLLIRFADYQNRIVFLLQLFAFLICTYLCRSYYIKTHDIHKKHTTSLTTKIIFILATFEIFICIDIIFIPSDASPIFYIKNNTYLLDDEDGGTIWLIPHIKIDRSIRLFTPEQESNDYLYKTGYDDEIYFISRYVSLDIRSRRLKFLDINNQILPRIWAHNADLSGANLSFTRLLGSTFVNTNLYGVNLSLSILDGSSFLFSNIKNSYLNNTHVKGSIFSDTNIENSIVLNSTFFGSMFFGSEITKSKLENNNFNSIYLFDTKIINNHINNNKKSYIFEYSTDNNETEIEQSKRFFEQDNKISTSNFIKEFCTDKISLSDKFSLYSIYNSYLISNEELLKSIHDAFEDKKCISVKDFISKVENRQL